MQALACGYYLFFLSVLVVLWLAWFALFRGRRARCAQAIAAWAVAAALLAPVLYGYWRFSRAYNLRRTVTEIRQFSADIASLLKAWDWSLAWGWLDVIHRPESDLFPGLTVVLIVAVGIVLAWRDASKHATGYPQGRARAARPRRSRDGGLDRSRTPRSFSARDRGSRLFSVTSPEKPVSVAALCFLSAALLHPAIRAAWRRRSAFGFYALATIAMWLMSLGPSPTLMNVPAIYKAPYAWLLLLPGADGIRVPARFWMLGVFCLRGDRRARAARASLQRWPRTATWLPALAVAGVLMDGWPRPLPMAAASAGAPGSRRGGSSPRAAARRRTRHDRALSRDRAPPSADQWLQRLLRAALLGDEAAAGREGSCGHRAPVGAGLPGGRRRAFARCRRRLAWFRDARAGAQLVHTRPTTRASSCRARRQQTRLVRGRPAAVHGVLRLDQCRAWVTRAGRQSLHALACGTGPAPRRLDHRGPGCGRSRSEACGC